MGAGIRNHGVRKTTVVQLLLFNEKHGNRL